VQGEQQSEDNDDRRVLLVENETADDYVMPVTANHSNEDIASNSEAKDQAMSYTNSNVILTGEVDIVKNEDNYKIFGDLDLGDRIYLIKNYFGASRIFKIRILRIEEDNDHFKFKFEEELDEDVYRKSFKKSLFSKVDRLKLVLDKLQKEMD